MTQLIRTTLATGAIQLGWFALGCIGAQVPGACPGTAAANAGSSTGVNTAAASTACPKGAQPAQDGAIDDFEDGNGQLTVMAGRDGYWWKAHDPEGSTIGPDSNDGEDGGPTGSTKVKHVFGVITTSGDAEKGWGVNMGVNFVNTKGTTFDASKYAGISFKAKVGPDSTKKVRFKVGDANTHPDVGKCQSCWNHFGKDLTLSTEWTEYTLFFSELKQADGWGKPRPKSVTPSELYNIDFSVNDKGQKFDLWVDDIQFVECKP